MEEFTAEKENIWNLPNFLTLCRILITFVVVYLIFADFHIIYIVGFFIIGMSTDFFDGLSARKLNLKTEFGRKFDMTADRILIVGTALAFVVKFALLGALTGSHYFQIVIMLIREILTIPVALITMPLGGGFPQVRTIGKITTLMQSIAFPAFLLSIIYPVFSFSLYLAIITGILGLISSFYYINDMRRLVIENRKGRIQG